MDGDEPPGPTSRQNIVGGAEACATLGLALWGLAALYALVLPFKGAVNFSAPNYYVTIGLVFGGLAVNARLLRKSNSKAQNVPTLVMTSALLSMFLFCVVAYVRYRSST